MQKFLIGLVAATLSLLSLSRAMANPQNPVLPAQVRALLPPGAMSFWGERMNIGYGGSKMFVHLWSIPRRKNAADMKDNTYLSYYNSPVCLDVFAPQLDAKKKWNWKLVSSASFVESQAPTRVTSRWLRPAKKQGAILDIVTAYPMPGVATSHQILAWPHDFLPGYGATAPQQLWTGGSGGGYLSLEWNGVDDKGFTTFDSVDQYGGMKVSSTPYTWNGAMFVVGKTRSEPGM